MTEDKILEIFSAAMWLAFKLAVPTLIIAMVVGLIIAILQAATQVHEQTLTFAPKAIAVALSLLIMAPWMITESIDFINYIFQTMSEVGL